MKLNGYKKVKIGKISQAKLKRALKGGSLSLSAAEVGGDDHELLLHPSNAKLFEKAEKAKKGVRLNVARGEIDYDQKAHADGDLSGGSIWDSIKNFFVSNATPLLDIVKNVATPFVGQDVADAGRSLVKSITGKGFAKGSPEMKAHMATLRSKRKLRGASFILS
ncbi:Aste57867_15262 [Aphanomyces stellatus]|uniref:Aste57867_15262 protein n=1 Tax=Aphanomyces stellatus TaxID=120398 RepID=A0A485L417_9STRA|nr:hypothetical protein As57867_015206 [Aphanomyces stellatus]VFT92071.1 Aste57867_15262 [Aphanomyces stellatus]